MGVLLIVTGEETKEYNERRFEDNPKESHYMLALSFFLFQMHSFGDFQFYMLGGFQSYTLGAYLLTCLMLTCLLAWCLLAYLLTCLLAYLLTCLLAYLLACLFARITAATSVSLTVQKNGGSITSDRGNELADHVFALSLRRRAVDLGEYHKKHPKNHTIWVFLYDSCAFVETYGVFKY